jgi:hypothetical protein
MACLSTIAQNIVNSCDDRPTGGMESIAYIMNRSALTATANATNPALITTLALSAPSKAYKITALKKENNSGFDAVISDVMPNLFTHYFAVQPYVRTAATVATMDTMGDVVIVVELKGKKAEGRFIILGLESGLHLSSASGRTNDNNGVPTYEYQTLPGEEESYSRYTLWSVDYTGTKAMLEALTA